MAVYGIKKKVVTVTLSKVAYDSIQKLAFAENKTVPGYIRSIVEKEISRNGLPLYWEGQENGSS